MKTVLAGVVAALAAGPSLAEVLLKPALSVSAHDGRFTGYSAALPLDLSTDIDKALLTAKVAGSLENPTYNLDLNLSRKPDDNPLDKRTLAVGASWNEREAAVRSSMSRLYGFGFLPSANYVSLSMDLDARQAVTRRDALPRARANLRSSLTLDGHQVGSIALGGGTMGQEGIDFSLTRPFDLPAEVTFSVRGEDEEISDSRVMVKLVKASW